MTGYAIQRLLYVVVVVWIMSVLIFAITQLLPGNVAYAILGQFATDRQIDGMTKLAAKAGQDYESFAKARMAEVPAGRFGTPEEFGRACAFLCSADASFIVGQNLLIDGGAVNMTL